MKVAYLGPFKNVFLKEFIPSLSDEDISASPGMGGHGLIELVIERLQTGKETAVITLDIANLGKPIIRNGPICELYSFPKRIHKSLLDLFITERNHIASAIKDVAPDIVHAHWTAEYALAAMDLGIPYVITSHDHPQDVLRFLGIRYLPLYFLSIYIIKRAKVISSVSGYVSEYINSLRRKGDCLTISNVLTTKYLQLSTNAARSYAISQPKIISVLDWNNLKNAKVAVQTFKLLLSEYHNSELHLFGRGLGPGEECEMWCNKRGINRNVFFHGFVPNWIIKDCMASASILLHTSRTESFGMVVAEAMAMGLPVVGGRDSGAIPDLLDHGKCGILVDINDPKDTLKGISLLLSSIDLRKKIGTAARYRARAIFGSQEILNRWESVYSGVIAEYSRKDDLQ